MSSVGKREARHRTVSAALASWSDDTLLAALAAGNQVGIGIGGSTARIDVSGIPVFVKLVRLTRRENRSEHVRRTSNLFGLPTWYQYGVGSAGFGAWRELRSLEGATRWVLDGACAHFPLLHHWRVLPRAMAAAPELGDADAIEESVRFWGGSLAVRCRLRALANAPATLVLALEYLPHTLHAWLTTQLLADQDRAAAACRRVEAQLLDAVRCMESHQVSHFDAHFHNILADDQRLYLSDFGLATSRHFDLSAAERRFFDQTGRHDRAYVVTQLANTVVSTLVVSDGPAVRNAYLRRCSRRGDTPGLPAPLAAMVRRYAPVAEVMNDFYWSLHAGRPTTRYPAERIENALVAGDLDV